MSERQLALKGQACVLAAKSAHDLIEAKEDTAKAAEILSALAEDGIELQRVAEEEKEKSMAREKELEKEIVRLTKEKDGYDLSVSQLNDQMRNEKFKLSQQEQTKSHAESDLSDAKSMLSSAQSELSRAKEKERATMATAVTTGIVVGLFTFGIGGVAAGAAMGAGIAALINELEGKVDKARARIKSRERDIASARRNIEHTNQVISDIHSRIQAYNDQIKANERGMKEAHDKISENKPTLAVHRQALELWELCAQKSEDATETTQRLEMIVQIANQEQNLKITKSNGTVKLAKSVVEAWEAITFDNGRITLE